MYKHKSSRTEKMANRPSMFEIPKPDDVESLMSSTLSAFDQLVKSAARFDQKLTNSKGPKQSFGPR